MIVDTRYGMAPLHITSAFIRSTTELDPDRPVVPVFAVTYTSPANNRRRPPALNLKNLREDIQRLTINVLIAEDEQAIVRL